jgi:TolB protein
LIRVRLGRPTAGQIVFVRDDTKDTSIVLIDAASGREKVLIDSPALDLDPVFSRDGRHVFYSSAESGDLDLWRIEMATGAKKRLTSDRGQELQPQPLPDDAQLLYVQKSVRLIRFQLLICATTQNAFCIRKESLRKCVLQLKPDGRSFVVNLPVQDRWQLWLMDTKGSPAIQIARDAKYPLMPAWSPDNSFIYFAEPDANERFRLYRIPPTGGTPEDVSPLSWNWGEPTRAFYQNAAAGSEANLPVRLTVVDGKGTSGSARSGQARLTGKTERCFFIRPA